MNFKLILPAILLFLICQTSYGQIEKEAIVGKWKGVKKELKNGETGENYTPDGKPYQYSTVMDLHADGNGKEYEAGLDFVYSIVDTILNLGNRQFIIEKLTQKELVVLSHNDIFPDNPQAVRLYFIKQTEID